MPWPFSRRVARVERGDAERIMTANVALGRRYLGDTRTRWLDLTLDLVESKRWEAVGDIDLTPEIMVTVAANAAVPILELDPWLYRQVQSIIVRPTTSVSTGVRSGPAEGTVSDEAMSTDGEAAPHSGPLSIAWDAAKWESRHPREGRNVVIHEFAHKIDMSDGYSDGTPPLTEEASERWGALLRDEYERPEEHPSDAVLDPYAWTNPAEFFAVATETFFCRPRALAEAKPRLHRALAEFYRQDPASDSI